MRYTATRQITHGALVEGAAVVTVAEPGDTVELDQAAAEALLACGALEPCADKPKRGRKAEDA
jgi:hypothetical protein